MTQLVLLDGSSLLYRAFYALPPLTSAEGLPTNGVHGFLTMLLKLQREQKPDYWAVVFDKDKPTVRLDYYPEYKAQRKEMPETLSPQFTYLKEILEAMSVPMLELAGYEADDIIATVTERAVGEDMEVSIYTGDRDALQLISPQTKVYITVRGITKVECYDEERLFEKYNLKPSQIVDLKALMGDVSDNIPGIPGIGEKTALKLLHEFETLENILQNKEEVKGKRLKSLIEEYQDQALLSKKLAVMIHDVPLKYTLNDLVWKAPDREQCRKIFHRYSLVTVARLFEQSLDARLGKEGDKGEFTEDNKAKPSLDLPEEIKMDSETWVEKIDDWLAQKPTLTLSYRYTGSGVHLGRWSEIGIYDGQNIYSLARNSISAQVEECFESLLAASTVPKIVVDSKALYSLLLNEGKTLEGLEMDLSLAAYLLNLNLSGYGAADLLKNFSPPENLTPAQEAYLLHSLKEKFKESLVAEGLETLLHEVEEPLSLVLARMEKAGITVDQEMLKAQGAELDGKLAALEEEIYTLAGSTFNINSPQQLGDVLFQDLGLPPKKRTKTGYSTNAETLEELRFAHPIVEKILQYRQLMKLRSTYVNGLLNEIREGKIHTTFQQTVTATGRLSSTEPNLQNIPIRLEEGRKLRKAFLPSKEDWLLLSADYSQIELRILAHYSQDPLLCESFLAGEDVHSRTASEVFGVSLGEVTRDMRDKAKAVNFGLIYGLTDYGLARDLSIPRKEAKFYIEQYFKRYSKVQTYLNETVRLAKEKGEVRTLFNRLRKIPELNHPNRMTRQFGERIAKNTPIQGSAADIMKIAMVQVAKELQGFKANLLLQVHDELLIEVLASDLEKVKEIVKQTMENCYKLTVPLVVDCRAGRNWYEMEEI